MILINTQKGLLEKSMHGIHPTVNLQMGFQDQMQINGSWVESSTKNTMATWLWIGFIPGIIGGGEMEIGWCRWLLKLKGEDEEEKMEILSRRHHLRLRRWADRRCRATDLQRPSSSIDQTNLPLITRWSRLDAEEIRRRLEKTFPKYTSFTFFCSRKEKEFFPLSFFLSFFISLFIFNKISFILG